MQELAITIVLIIFLTYLVAGAVFVIPFQIKGLQKVDENVHGSSIGFRIIIIPGCILFWPLLLERWLYAIKQDKKKYDRKTYK